MQASLKAALEPGKRRIDRPAGEGRGGNTLNAFDCVRETQNISHTSASA